MVDGPVDSGAVVPLALIESLAEPWVEAAVAAVGSVEVAPPPASVEPALEASAAELAVVEASSPLHAAARRVSASAPRRVTGARRGGLGSNVLATFMATSVGASVHKRARGGTAPGAPRAAVAARRGP